MKIEILLNPLFNKVSGIIKNYFYNKDKKNNGLEDENLRDRNKGSRNITFKRRDK